MRSSLVSTVGGTSKSHTPKRENTTRTFLKFLIKPCKNKVLHWTMFTFALFGDQFLTHGAALNTWERTESHQGDGEPWCRQRRGSEILGDTSNSPGQGPGQFQIILKLIMCWEGGWTIRMISFKLNYRPIISTEGPTYKIQSDIGVWTIFITLGTSRIFNMYSA